MTSGLSRAQFLCMFAVVFRLVSVRSVACSLSREMGGGALVAEVLFFVPAMEDCLWACWC
ncbi:hypothetical protein [Anaplasma marginale]|uniref:hypothetical protein n=1 Tax=Anaplasma marginale TaxID=770 RepID=UPI001300C60C|nr:hypothetical protein [Anaplasma marginale]